MIERMRAFVLKHYTVTFIVSVVLIYGGIIAAAVHGDNHRRAEADARTDRIIQAIEQSCPTRDQ